MPADLVPNASIPGLASSMTPEDLDVLRHIQEAGYVQSSDVDEKTFAILQRLAVLGLVDQGFTAAMAPKPWMWVSNGNGLRVLRYLTGIRSRPHYEIPSAELATWLEEQGKHRWWNVDGDPLLTGRMTFPCPAAELAAELRAIGRPLLIQAKKDDTGAKGQVISKEKLNAVVERFAGSLQVSGGGRTLQSGGDRLLYLCWKGTSNEWLLAEDSETTEQMQAEERDQGNNVAQLNRK
jgi:hypothetical protein